MPNFEYVLLQTIALLITALLVPGLKVSGPLGAALTVIVLGLLNATIWDAALFFSLPESLSLQMFVVLLANGAFFWFVVKLLPGISVKGILPAIVSPVVFTIVGVFCHRYGRDIDWSAVWESAATAVREFRKQYAK